MKQREGEGLRGYLNRFKAAALDVLDASSDVLVNACVQGIREGHFFRSLAKRAPSNYDELLARADKYVNLEKAEKIIRATTKPPSVRRIEPEPEPRPPGAVHVMDRKLPATGALPDYLPPLPPLTATLPVIHQAIHTHPDLRWPLSHQIPPKNPKS